MTATHVEREDKYDVGATFRLPAKLTDDAATTVHLESTYFDTADHDLLRQRITLRRRAGDDDTGWHLKIPHGAARLEIRLPLQAGDGEVPDQLGELLEGIAHGERLAPSAVLKTERRRHLVRDGRRVLAEIADDTVHAAATGVAARLSEWREIEVELVDGDDKVLRRVGKALRAAGAERSTSSSKLARALDWTAPAAPDVDDARDLLRGYLRDQLAALSAGDVSLRRGLDPVHKTRVAARRIRSVVRVFGTLLDPTAAADLDRELSWYQDILGAVRDAQVQRARFTGILAGLPVELVLGPVAADIESDLLGTQARALDDVRGALRSERYHALLSAVREWADDPPLHSDATVRDLQRLAERARRRAAKRLARGVRAGGDDLHRARKAAKRSRYAAELLRPAVGKAAGRSVARHKQLQNVLGEYQDSVVASAHLRRLGAAAARSGRNGFTFGLLYAKEEQRRTDLLRDAGRLEL